MTNLKIDIKQKDLNLEKYDIRETIEMLKEANKALRPLLNKGETIGHKSEEGSVVHLFLIPLTTLTLVNSQIENIQKGKYHLATNLMPFVDYLQTKSKKNNQTIELSLGDNYSTKLKINSKTSYYQSNIWINTDLYLHGEITKVGGKGKTSLQVETEEYGNVIVGVDKEQAIKNNYLYKEHRILVDCKQNVKTGEIKEAKALIIEQYNNVSDFRTYMDKKIQLGTETWKGTDVNKWLKSIR